MVVVLLSSYLTTESDLLTVIGVAEVVAAEVFVYVVTIMIARRWVVFRTTLKMGGPLPFVKP